MQLQVQALSDTSAYVAWLDQSKESYRVWGAVARIAPNGSAIWEAGEPKLLAKGTIVDFRVLVVGSRIGLATTTYGQLRYEPDIREPAVVTLNGDSEYVESFAAYSSGGRDRFVAIASNYGDRDHVRTAVVSYDCLPGRIVRQHLVDETPSSVWPCPRPSFVVVGDTLCVFIAVDRQTFRIGSRHTAPGALSVMKFMRPLSGQRGWGSGTLYQAWLDEDLSHSPKPVSFQSVPGGQPACVVGSDRSYLVIWPKPPQQAQVLPLTARDGTGDDHSQLIVGAVERDLTHAVVAWIDASRQMAHPEAAYAIEVDPSVHGGDIKFGTFDRPSMALHKSRIDVLPARTTAECIALARIGNATLVGWAGPRWATDAPSQEPPDERIFLQLVPDARW